MGILVKIWETLIQQEEGEKEEDSTALVGVPLIEEREEIINNRESFGVWEVDMVV
ncbi:MAG: hypothetical protein LBU27_02520 [Candidatus Peribacteria bacterium]|jgi:IS30 family transposase|nr:hypothetical protein [Candidatus Peribacteria bacterium]